MYEEILQSLRQHKGSYRQISDATGLDYDWLHQVSSGRIKDPGIKKMEQLKSHLDLLGGSQVDTSAA